MITKEDLEIYTAIFQEKSITEKYLGFIFFDWEYSIIHYNADCTLAIPFDLFDEVIVGILLVDEVLSIEELGAILGMNLINNPENLQYKDEAEFDILRIALDNLKDYNMIEIGDTSYSSCKLTSEGKRFAENGYKFKIEQNKPFILCYDHTTNSHTLAKLELGISKGIKGPLKGDFNFCDENLLKAIAEVQVPEIHNSKLGNSFINQQIDYSKSHSFTLIITVALLFDIETKQTRLLAFENISKKANPNYTSFLNSQKIKLLDIFNDILDISHVEDNQLPYFEKLKHQKKQIERLSSSKPQEALFLFKKINTELDFIDVEYFWLNLEDFCSKDVTEIYLLIPEANEIVISRIKRLSENKEIPFLFIVFQQSKEDAINEKIHQLYQLSIRTDNKLFVAVYAEVNSFECLIKNKMGIVTIEEFYLNFINEDVNYSKLFYRNNKITLNELPKNYIEIKKSFADDYVNLFEEELKKISENIIKDELINKKFILEQSDNANKSYIFSNTELSLDSKESLARLSSTNEKYLTQIKNRHQILLGKKLSELSSLLKSTNSNQIEDFTTFENNLKELEQECFDDYIEFREASNLLMTKIKAEMERIKEEVLTKTYIIDTNVFIKDPDIIAKIDPKHYIALSLTVIEELDNLKIRPETKENAIKAIININNVLQKSKDSKKSSVRKARPDLTLLPEELQRKTADNLLLSLGLVYRKNNPILLTLDRNLQSKAILLDVPLITVYELLGINEESKAKPKIISKERNDQNEYLKIFNSLKPDKNGEYLISDFIYSIRKQNPTFDFKKQGYENVFKFILSLRIFKVYKSKFLKLK